MADINNSTLLEKTTGIPKKDACVVIVRTEWNAAIVDKLEEGCKKGLARHGIEKVRTLTVPGAFEIPFGIKSYWETFKYLDDRPSAFIALGCVLRGDTPHFDYICKGVTDGMMQLNLSLPIPSVFGILTVDNQQQADERTGGKHGNKGEEAALTAIKMIALQQSYKSIERKSDSWP
ncbi:MAG: 6,7-dimethyl-8-ribityllumazine synthase [Chitinophagaceae bacterium]